MENLSEKPPGESAEQPIEQPAEQQPEELLERELSLVGEEFEKVFKIKSEELDSIPDFSELSDGQQSLALKNFKELTLKGIEEKAIEQTKEETAKAGFVGKVWHGFFRQYYLAKAEKLNADSMLNGGIDLHREALTEVVRQIKESGLDAEIDEKERKLRILYAGRFENLGPEEQATVAKFNQAADKFVQASSEWRYSKREKTKFAKLENEYRKALADVGLAVKLEEIRKGKTYDQALALEVSKYMADIDKRVRLSQFLSSNPGANGELEKIQSKPVWQKALRNTLLERGGYMAMGFAARTATVSLLGLVAAPLTAAGIGGWIARQRAVGTLREEAKLAESGKKHSELITAVKSENLEKKLDSLLAKLESAEGVADKVEIVNELDTRLNYTRYKLESGLIQYGEGAEKIKHQYSLLQKLSEAEVMTRFYGGGKEGKIKIGSEAAEKVEKRLNEWLQFKERKVQKDVKGQIIRGALMGAGFAVLGYGLRDLYEKLGIDLGIERTIKGAAEGSWQYIKDLIGKDTAPSESLETLVSQGGSLDTLAKGIAPLDTAKALLRTGVSPDSLVAAGAKADSVQQALAELHPELQPVASAKALEELFSQHPEFKGDSTWKVGASGLITREGYGGWYLADKKGDLWWSGGKLPSGEESGPQVLRVGATEWAETEELAVPGTKEMMEQAAQEAETAPELGEKVTEVEPKTVKPPSQILESKAVESQTSISPEEIEAVKKMFEVSPEQMELATIGKGEGVTHVLVRQLKVDPEKFGYDPKSGMSVDRWAVLKSRDIAIENGYIRPDGSEVRVLHLGEGKNPAYVLDQDVNGKFHVREFLEGKPSGGGKLSPYEYEWKPPKTGMTAEEIEARAAHPEKMPVKSIEEVAKERYEVPGEKISTPEPTEAKGQVFSAESEPKAIQISADKFLNEHRSEFNSFFHRLLKENLTDLDKAGAAESYAKVLGVEPKAVSSFFERLIKTDDIVADLKSLSPAELKLLRLLINTETEVAAEHKLTLAPQFETLRTLLNRWAAK